VPEVRVYLARKLTTFDNAVAQKREERLAL
jgi:hypothetical protein